MNKVLVISPSGNWYGSEQVLYDYLKQTKLTLDVQVPAGSMFSEKLSATQFPHTFKTFGGSLPRFYARVFFWLLNNKYRSVYINEAGHIRYISWLASVFPKKKFIAHVRVLEDVSASRWKQGDKKNIDVIAISQFIQTKLPVKSHLLYDGYSFTNKATSAAENFLPVLRIAIIGRITKTKGTNLVPRVIEYLKSSDPTGQYHFRLFGTVAEDMAADQSLKTMKDCPEISFEGFEENRDKIYTTVDCVVHLSPIEPLGRIFFEAIDYAKPFVGVRAGGIGEIGEALNLTDLLVDPNPENMASEIAARLVLVRNHYAKYVSQFTNSKKDAARIFDPVRYAGYMDNLLGA